MVVTPSYLEALECLSRRGRTHSPQRRRLRILELPDGSVDSRVAPCLHPQLKPQSLSRHRNNLMCTSDAQCTAQPNGIACISTTSTSAEHLRLRSACTAYPV